MLAAPVFAALDEVARRRAERVVRRPERRDLAVAVIVDAGMEPDFGHPLSVAHGARPRADHFCRRTPALLNDGQRVDQLGFPVFAPPRLGPCQRRQRGNDRPHVVLLHQRIAEGRLDAPDAEHDRGLDAIVALDARKQRRVLFCLRPAGDDAPIGNAAIEILPELLVELGLIAERFKPGRVGPHGAHDARVGFRRDTARQRFGAKPVDPLIERRG